MRATQRILIVDDDQGIRDLLGKFLQQHGYDAELAKDGKEMDRHFQKRQFDLVVLDIMLPGDDGLTLCRRLRNESTIPIIMLTAISEEVERILGLELGADDYLSKPFNPRELLARIKAILRRSSNHDSANNAYLASKENVVYVFADWQLNQANRCLVSPEGLEMTLSSGEYDLLLAMLQRPQQVLSRDYLLDLTRNRPATPYDRSVDIQISRLRNKIEKEPRNPKIIKTVRGGGYVLSVEVTRDA